MLGIVPQQLGVIVDADPDHQQCTRLGQQVKSPLDRNHEKVRRHPGFHPASIHLPREGRELVFWQSSCCEHARADCRPPACTGALGQQGFIAAARSSLAARTSSHACPALCARCEIGARGRRRRTEGWCGSTTSVKNTRCLPWPRTSKHATAAARARRAGVTLPFLRASKRPCRAPQLVHWRLAS